MATQDYYKLLGVSPGSSLEEIRKAYRKQALATHPDRNPDNPRAEDQFKRINEAYAILSNPQKRAEYDNFQRMRAAAGQRRAAAGGSARGFRYTQDDIFRDFFKNQQAGDFFSQLQQEFKRMGFRFDESFFSNLFFSDRAGYQQQVFWVGPGGVRVFRYGNVYGDPKERAREAERRKAREAGPKSLLGTGLSLLGKAGKKVGGFLVRKALDLVSPSDAGDRLSESGKVAGARSSDVIYNVTITVREAQSGGVFEIDLPHLTTDKRVAVRIPAGVKEGSKLRLRNMGRPLQGHGGARGDVFLQLQVR